MSRDAPPRLGRDNKAEGPGCLISVESEETYAMQRLVDSRLQYSYVKEESQSWCCLMFEASHFASDIHNNLARKGKGGG